MELLGAWSAPVPAEELEMAGGLGMPNTFLAADKGKNGWIVGV